MSFRSDSVGQRSLRLDRNGVAEQHSVASPLLVGTTNSVGSGVVKIASLPSSAAGLSSGALWYDPAAANVVKYVP